MDKFGCNEYLPMKLNVKSELSGLNTKIQNYVT